LYRASTSETQKSPPDWENQGIQMAYRFAYVVKLVVVWHSDFPGYQYRLN
jgi:hypothetical protein